jgi:hypothetical protein
MAGTSRGVYCERCGTYLDLVGAVPVHSCPACHSIACQSCWNVPRRRCDGCATAGAATAPRLRTGVARAEAVLQDLDQLDTELGLVLKEANPILPPAAWPDDDVELQLLRARLNTLLNEAEVDLDRASQRSARQAMVIRQRVQRDGAALEQRIADIQLKRLRSSEAVPRRAVLRSWRRPSRSAALIHGAAAAVLLVAVATVALFPAGSPEAPSSTPPPDDGTAGGILGGNPADSTPAPDATPAASAPDEVAQATQITFDELRMTVPIGSDWRVDEGTRDQVRVAPLPSVVDRSLELSASGSGAGVTLCRSIPSATDQLVIDARVESADSQLLVALASAGQTERPATWMLAAGAAPDAAVDETVHIDAAAWFRFELTTGAARDATWQVGHLNGTTRSTAVAGGEVALPAAQELCIGLADGAPDGVALIDDLTIGTTQ